jgi:hypothetical protein
MSLVSLRWAVDRPTVIVRLPRTAEIDEENSRASGFHSLSLKLLG